MFGKPEWFQAEKAGFLLRPVAWQGWTFNGLWAGAIALPFLGLLTLTLVPEALVWLAASTGGYWFDKRQVVTQWKAANPEPESDVFVIDEDTDITRAATENYHLNLRR
ncbi:MAG: hypothetical protein ACI9HK_003341 [Pirellulaceae bacterium]|jgi:hypothetical protein